MRMPPLRRRTRGDRALETALHRLPLPGDGPPRVAVLRGPDGSDSDVVEALRAAFPQARVLRPGPGTVPLLERRLRRRGPFDLIIDVAPAKSAQHLHRLHRLALHLSAGGVYVVDRAAVLPGGRDLAAELERLRPHVGRRRQEMRGLGARRRHLARAITGVWSDRRLVGVVMGTQPLLKLRHAHATQVVNRRGGPTSVTELAALPPGVLPPPPRVTSHGGEGAGLDAEMRYPRLPLRRYEGEIILGPGGLAVADGLVLPDSFRWHLETPLRHPALEDLGPYAARFRATPQVRHLKGSYYHFDYANSGHYGHLMTEAVAKLWGWQAAKAADPGLKILSRIAARHVGTDVVPPDIDLLLAFGVDPEDIVRVDGWVSVDTLVAAAPMWHNHEPFHAHPGIAGVWERLRTGLVQDEEVGSPHIFVGRREGNRTCRNAEQVEEAFRAAGFRIVLPGALSRAAQASVFAGASVVAGFAGTGMFNLAYSHRVERVVVLSHDAYDARNEHLYAAVHRAEIDYLWSPADIAHPDGGWSYDAFQSPWSFDFERNGAALTSLLQDLGRRPEVR